MSNSSNIAPLMTVSADMDMLTNAWVLYLEKMPEETRADLAALLAGDEPITDYVSANRMLQQIMQCLIRGSMPPFLFPYVMRVVEAQIANVLSQHAMSGTTRIAGHDIRAVVQDTLQVRQVRTHLVTTALPVSAPEPIEAQDAFPLPLESSGE